MARIMIIWKNQDPYVIKWEAKRWSKSDGAAEKDYMKIVKIVTGSNEKHKESISRNDVEKHILM